MLHAWRGRGSCQWWHLNNGGFLVVNITRLTWRAPHCHFAFLEVYVEYEGDSWRSEKIASTVAFKDSSTPPCLNLFRNFRTTRHERERTKKKTAGDRKWFKLVTKIKLKRLHFSSPGFTLRPKFSIMPWKVCCAEGPQCCIPYAGELKSERCALLRWMCC